MIMERETGREIVHIKQRYNINGVKVKAEETHNLPPYDITELRYSTIVNELCLCINIWRLYGEPDTYNFSMMMFEFRSPFNVYRTCDEISGDMLDRAMRDTLAAFAIMAGADSEREVLSKLP